MKALKMAVLLAALLSVPLLSATVVTTNHSVFPTAVSSVQLSTSPTHLQMSMISTAVFSSFQNQNGQGGNNQGGNSQGGNNQDGNSQGGKNTVHGAEMNKTAILLAGLLALSVFLFLRRSSFKRS